MTQLPTLALRGLTVFPNMMIHFDVGRESSVRALEAAMASGEPIFLIAQRDLRVEAPEQADLFPVGTVSQVRQILRLPGKAIRVMVEGTTRARLERLTQTEPHLVAELTLLEQSETKLSVKAEALVRQAYELFERYTELSPRLSPELLTTVMASEDPAYIADFIAQNVVMRITDKQSILEELRPSARLTKLLKLLGRELEILELEQEIQSQVQDNLSRTQRDAVLREQLKVIRRELGETERTDDEMNQYRTRIMAAKLPSEVEKKLLKELANLERQHFGSAESSVLRNYLDICLELPWSKSTKERVQIEAARRQLTADHFGLEKVKERLLEFLAVKQLAPALRGEILCLVGPPGVGKTSIASSMAKAMNRNFARISLGGVHDEAEIRGHRKTYVGAMPGRIINAMKQAGSKNPVLLLDEIDKMGTDHRGDPASALLEVLDAQQNNTFRDHFIELPFDLSEVLFVMTANNLDTIPRPLLDRMEIIELASYTDEEKLQIAKGHLLPRELRRHGLNKRQLSLTDDAIRELIVSYTRESGVRILERKLADVCRKTAMKLVSGEGKAVRLTGDTLESLLGTRRYHPERNGRESRVGVVNGLAFTSVGGTLLEVEANVVPGSGKLELTGNLGEVMKESGMAALSYIRSRATQLGLPTNFYKENDIHVHFPEGAVPKDGPSAGITVTVAMVSALTDTPVRGDIAMTGEISLRGRVLPIGGLREKSMAALRNGIHTVMIPKENEKDLAEIDQTVRTALHFIPVEHVDQVLSHALERSPLSPADKAPAALSDAAASRGSRVNLTQ